jgi:hypothetical protein
LNRPAYKAYTDGTATVTYGYGEDLSGGTANYAKGRLTSVTSGTATTKYNPFDKAGRVLQYTQAMTGATGSP